MAALSEQDRSILREAAQATVDIDAGTDSNAEAQSVGELCRGGEVAFDRASPAQVDALRAKLEPVYQWLREDPATSGFHRSDPAAVRVSAGRSGGRDCHRLSAIRHERRGPAAATPIDGTYSVTTTLDDLKASGAAARRLGAGDTGASRSTSSTAAGLPPRNTTTRHARGPTGAIAVDGDLLTLDLRRRRGAGPERPRPPAGSAFRCRLEPVPGRAHPVADGRSARAHGVRAHVGVAAGQLHAGRVGAQSAVPAAGRGLPRLTTAVVQPAGTVAATVVPAPRALLTVRRRRAPPPGRQARAARCRTRGRHRRRRHR